MVFAVENRRKLLWRKGLRHGGAAPQRPKSFDTKGLRQ
jgi:hypothetical protein